jgi:hypothetical protein
MQKSGPEINIKDRLKPLFANNVARLQIREPTVVRPGGRARTLELPRSDCNLGLLCLIWLKTSGFGRTLVNLWNDP